jgi:hypothetical protein
MADQLSNRDRIVEFGGFEVVYVSGERGQPIPEQAPAAFDALEARLPTLRKKRFYGAVIDGAYRACVAVDEDTSTLDLPRWVIPSGRYAGGRSPTGSGTATRSVQPWPSSVAVPILTRRGR